MTAETDGLALLAASVGPGADRHVPLGARAVVVPFAAAAEHGDRRSRAARRLHGLPGLPRLRILRPTSLDATAPPTSAPLRRRLTLLPVGGAGRRRARPKRPPRLPADAAREGSAAARAIGRG